LSELDSTFPNELVGLVSYSTTSRVDSRLTNNYTTVRNQANAYNANGFTAIGLGLQDGIRVITGSEHRPFAIQTIVLMTDGIHNTGVNPTVPAADAARLGITVHTVTFGSDADRTLMRRVAAQTGGEHFHADSSTDLSEVFRTIARTLPVLLTE
jgi:Mg-chelatase subunit ChlD